MSIRKFNRKRRKNACRLCDMKKPKMNEKRSLIESSRIDFSRSLPQHLSIASFSFIQFRSIRGDFCELILSSLWPRLCLTATALI